MPPQELSILTQTKRDIRSDPRLHLPSRLAWLMTELIWAGSTGRFYMRPETMETELTADGPAIDRALRSVTREYKLFRWDPGRDAYVRNGTTDSAAFKLAAQQRINTTVGIAWILCDIVKLDTPAPHSNRDFATQLNCTTRAVKLAIKPLLEGEPEYFVRIKRKPPQGSLFVHPKFTGLDQLQARYERYNRPPQLDTRRYN